MGGDRRHERGYIGTAITHPTITAGFAAALPGRAGR